jgi:hypothetical protein
MNSTEPNRIPHYISMKVFCFCQAYETTISKIEGELYLFKLIPNQYVEFSNFTFIICLQIFELKYLKLMS